jgi:hypothetical protein
MEDQSWFSIMMMNTVTGRVVLVVEIVEVVVVEMLETAAVGAWLTTPGFPHADFAAERTTVRRHTGRNAVVATRLLATAAAHRR